VDGTGNVYIADTNNDAIRLGVFPAAPLITAQPQSQTVTQGGSVLFSVTASGQPAPAFQWYFNGQTITGATGASLNLTSVQASNAGNYTVTATNSSGSVTSNVATLTVNAASSSQSSSAASGGGGGAVDAWFLAALALLCLVRARRTR
jgi:hypothetical protein